MKTFFLLHLQELKYNLYIYFYMFILNFIICYFYSDQIIFLLIKPLLFLKKSNYFIFTDIIEIFLMKFILTFIISFIFSIFFFLFQFWFFLAPGLYKTENIKIFINIFIFIFLYIIYNYLILTKIIPNTWFFFINFEKISFLYNISFEPKIYNYIFFILKLIITISLFFQYPLILLIFLKNFSKKKFIKYRKFFYFKIIILASFISPPDIFSQIMISLPLICFFEILILIKFFQK